MAVKHTVMLLVAVCLYLPGLSHGFQPSFSVDETHRDITRKAVLRKTAEVCRDLAFNLKIDDNLSVQEVQKACFSSSTYTTPLSTDIFQTALNEIYGSNEKVYFSLVDIPEFHFHSETFLGGRDIITRGSFTPTCKSCTGDACADNILPEVLKQGLLTSGYFSTFSSSKPTGKCSHGGLLDKTRKRDPVGGINKDSFTSDHGTLHRKAANLAVDATMELLEDIRLAAGDRNFLRLMGLSQSYALCFVIDTTGSMGDDIDAFNIIDSNAGTLQEPSQYILVPFNDPEFGPVIKTTDKNYFKEEINKLTAFGGGDEPELSMSGLQLALTSAPPSSKIYVFTDASAKDSHLKSTNIALIERTKTEVSFLLTNIFFSRRRRSIDGQDFSSRAVRLSDVQLYRDLAQASGGQAIEVRKSDLSMATTVIKDSSAGAVVTVFQVVMDPGRPDNFNFTVDSSVSNVIIYITGVSSLTFTLTSSAGVSQESSQTSGPLASLTTVGNLRRISLNAGNQTGVWQIHISSNSPYSIKVTGQSSVNFIYNLVELQQEGGIRPKEGRPATGGNVTLLVTVTGSDTVKVTEVTLFDSSVPKELTGSIQSLESSNFLVTFSEVPAGDYVVRLQGEDTSTTSRSTSDTFQRQASTRITTASLSVAAQADSINIEPGTSITIPFTVSSDVTGTFRVQVSNDRSFDFTSPGNVSIGPSDGGKANGTITLTVPASTGSGTDVTLTIQAQNAAATDTNYAVLRFSVAAKTTDLSSPVCQIVNISGICNVSSILCASSQWEFIANLTDGINGTGIASITLHEGNGTLDTSTVVGAGGENITLVTYTASCCSQNVVLAAVDRAGNVGTCMGQARLLATPAPMTTTTPVPTTTSLTTTTPVPTTTPSTIPLANGDTINASSIDAIGDIGDELPLGGSTK
ncbi:von Willebrand factor A domain-containing protein 7-like [Oreochromis aureus]|nr:von Willebrand factor A domain-containing protein 7-like [Oreochromis aureus]